MVGDEMKPSWYTRVYVLSSFIFLVVEHISASKTDLIHLVNPDSEVGCLAPRRELKIYVEAFLARPSK